MERTELLQEIKMHRFEEAYQGLGEWSPEPGRGGVDIGSMQPNV
jgi:hypothetical protein